MTHNAIPTIDPACFDGFVKLVHKLTGITIKPERQSMLEGRLRCRVRDLGLSGFSEYLAYVKSHAEEHEAFVNQVTTNETYFFRTPRVWDYVENTFLPQWYSEHANRTLKVWSAASSTGEEAHTLGILMQHFKDNHVGFEYQITGTDIDTKVISTATLGVYKGRSVERFRQAKPDWFSQYMNGDDDKGYTVLPAIKSRIRFSQLNLFSSAPATEKMNLVLLRNVLIYFTASDQERVMNSVHRRLDSNGVAIIGESESLNSLQTSFESIAPTIYRPCGSSISKAA